MTEKTPPTIAGFARSSVSDLANRGNLMLVGAGLLVLLLGWSGGLNQARPAGMQQLSALSSTSSHVEAKHLLVDVGKARETETGMEVPLLITVTGDRYFGGGLDLAKTFVLLDAPKQPAPQFKREGARGTGGMFLSPGVPTEVVAIWPAGANGDTLQVNSLSYRASSLDQSMQWLDPEPVAEVKIR